MRCESSEVRPAIREVVRAAFGSADGPEVPVEVPLTDALFNDVGYLSGLSLVGVVDDRVVGFVIGTRGWVGRHPAVGIGPLAVHPDMQGRGVGSALMNALIDSAREQGETLLALLGDPDYYDRFGFREAANLGVGSPDPDWGRHFQTLSITADAPTGTFRYAAPFDEL
ncbi:hypothetical protein B1964_26385 [Gordonia sp. i37]|nr:hypothetical protein B1964_26385 [Gordonia sp. i37]